MADWKAVESVDSKADNLVATTAERRAAVMAVYWGALTAAQTAVL
jgi:hypothetical protein